MDQRVLLALRARLDLSVSQAQLVLWVHKALQEQLGQLELLAPPVQVGQQGQPV